MGVAKETRVKEESTPQPPVKKDTDPKDDVSRFPLMFAIMENNSGYWKLSREMLTVCFS
jgi:hypothetical protein